MTGFFIPETSSRWSLPRGTDLKPPFGVVFILQIHFSRSLTFHYHWYIPPLQISTVLISSPQTELLQISQPSARNKGCFSRVLLPISHQHLRSHSRCIRCRFDPLHPCNSFPLDPNEQRLYVSCYPNICFVFRCSHIPTCRGDFPGDFYRHCYLLRCFGNVFGKSARRYSEVRSTYATVWIWVCSASRRFGPSASEDLPVWVLCSTSSIRELLASHLYMCWMKFFNAGMTVRFETSFSLNSICFF